MEFADLVAIGAVVVLSFFLARALREDRGATPPRGSRAGLSVGLAALPLYIAGLGWGLVSALMSDETRITGWVILCSGALLLGFIGRDRGLRALVARAGGTFSGVLLAGIVFWSWANGYRLAIPWKAEGSRSFTEDLELVFVGGVVAYLIASLLARWRQWPTE